MATYGKVDPRVGVVRQIIDNAPDYLDESLVTTAIIESGLRPNAVGDGGRSHGLFQEYDLGRGAGVPVESRRNPADATRRAVKEFDTFYNRGARGASLAYRSQRPADQGAYTERYNSTLAEARRLIAAAGGTGRTVTGPTAAGSPGSRSTDMPAAGGGQPTTGGMSQAIASALGIRQPGQRLIQSVTQGAIAGQMAQAQALPADTREK